MPNDKNKPTEKSTSKTAAPKKGPQDQEAQQKIMPPGIAPDVQKPQTVKPDSEIVVSPGGSSLEDEDRKRPTDHRPIEGERQGDREQDIEQENVNSRVDAPLRGDDDMEEVPPRDRE